jgi:hypothetical protein
LRSRPSEPGKHWGTDRQGGCKNRKQFWRGKNQKIRDDSLSISKQKTRLLLQVSAFVKLKILTISHIATIKTVISKVATEFC